MVRGSGSDQPSGGPRAMARVSRANGRWPVRCGLGGRMGRPPRVDGPEWSWRSASRPALRSARCIPPPRPPRRTDRLGPLSRDAGRCRAGRGRADPRGPDHPDAVRRAGRCPAAVPVRPRSSAALLVWALAIVGRRQPARVGDRPAGDRPGGLRCGRRPASRPLARVLAEPAGRRHGRSHGSPSRDGRPASQLVVGPFGVAVVHEMAPLAAIRQVGSTRGRPGPRTAGRRPSPRWTGRPPRGSPPSRAQRGRPRLHRSGPRARSSSPTRRSRDRRPARSSPAIRSRPGSRRCPASEA